MIDTEITPAPLRFGCAKCGRPLTPNVEACPRCGLVFALWKAAGGSRSEQKLDPIGERLWGDVCGAWSDESRHDAFVKHCSQSNLLGFAGRLYRTRLDQSSSDEIARKMQARIVAMVSATLQPLRTSEAAPVTRSRWFWVIVGFGLMGGAAAALVASFVQK